MVVTTEKLLGPSNDEEASHHIQDMDASPLTNPLQMVGRTPSHTKNVGPLPSNLRANSDGTLSIYRNMSGVNGAELFTEIPFTAIHGMQTIPRNECEAFGGMEICQKKDAMSIDLEHLAEERHSIPLDSGVTKTMFLATMAAATSQFLLGFNCVVLNTPEKFVFPGHSTLQWSISVASLSIGGPIGAFLGGRFADDYGRRRTLIITSLGFLVGGVIQTWAPALQYIAGARFIIGVASGISSVLVPIYLGELAPPQLRGTLGTINHFAMVLGILSADLLSFAFANEDDWRKLFSVTVFLPALQLLVAPFIVESPRWLLQGTKNENAMKSARETLTLLRNYANDKLLEMELSSYHHAVNIQTPRPGKATSVYKEMMHSERVRYLFFCCVGLHVAQQLSGVNVVFYYSTTFFEGIIENPLLGTTLIGAVNVMFTYVALLLMDSCRRKSLLLWSLGGMFLACWTLVLAQIGIFGGNVALVAVNVYVAFFEIGMGPIPWLIIAEMFEAKYVALAMSLCSQLNWLVCFVVSLGFPSMNEVLGEFTFVPYGVILFICFFSTWKFVPETQGKAPHQVMMTPKTIRLGSPKVHVTPW